MHELTPVLLVVIQRTMSDTYQSLERAIRDPQDEDDRRILESWTGIQTLMGSWLGDERDAGAMTEEQYEYAMDWLVNWVESGPVESGTLLDGWLQWTGNERYCREED